MVGRVDDEKLMLHARERLVVRDLLEEALLGLGGLPLDRGYPGVKRGGVEGTGEEVRVVGCHQCVLVGRKMLTVCGPSAKNLSCSKVNTRSFLV